MNGEQLFDLQSQRNSEDCARMRAGLLLCRCIGSTKVEDHVIGDEFVSGTTYRDLAIDALVALVLENTPTGSSWRVTLAMEVIKPHPAAAYSG